MSVPVRLAFGNGGASPKPTRPYALLSAESARMGLVSRRQA
jgi:hypothetical protein